MVRKTCWASTSGEGSFRVLSINVLVTGEKNVDDLLGNRSKRTPLTGDMHRASDILNHDCGLDRVPRIVTDREHPVILHEDGAGTVIVKSCNNAPTDRLVTDECEWAHRDLPTKLICHRRDDTGNWLGARRPRRGIGGVGVHHTAHVGSAPIDKGVRCGIRGGESITSFGAGHDRTLERAENHVFGSYVVVVDAAWLDDETILSWHSAGDVTAGPHNEAVAHQVTVQGSDLIAHDPLSRGLKDRGGHAGIPRSGATVVWPTPGNTT